MTKDRSARLAEIKAGCNVFSEYDADKEWLITELEQSLKREAALVENMCGYTDLLKAGFDEADFQKDWVLARLAIGNFWRAIEGIAKSHRASQAGKDE